jgi:hypothetical protein
LFSFLLLFKTRNRLGKKNHGKKEEEEMNNILAIPK